MSNSFCKFPVFAAAGVLSAAFMLGGCAPDDISLPSRESPQRRALYEQCLKKLPDAQAAELRESREALYFSGMAKHDDLLRACVKQMGTTPVL